MKKVIAKSKGRPMKIMSIGDIKELILQRCVLKKRGMRDDKLVNLFHFLFQA